MNRKRNSIYLIITSDTVDTDGISWKLKVTKKGCIVFCSDLNCNNDTESGRASLVVRLIWSGYLNWYWYDAINHDSAKILTSTHIDEHSIASSCLLIYVFSISLYARASKPTNPCDTPPITIDARCARLSPIIDDNIWHEGGAGFGMCPRFALVDTTGTARRCGQVSRSSYFSLSSCRVLWLI